MTMQIPGCAWRSFPGLVVDAARLRGRPPGVRIPATERDCSSRFFVSLLQKISAPLLGLLLALALSAAAHAAPFAYITNQVSSNVSVIDSASNSVVATVPVGICPFGVAVTPDGAFVYVANFVSNNVSVIASASNSVVATVPVGLGPFGVAVTPDGAFVYVANANSNSVSVIASASNSAVATVPVGSAPVGVAVTPDGAFVYVANLVSSNVSVIASASNSVVATVPVGLGPFGVAVTPDGAFVYVANADSNVSVIASAGNAVVATVGAGTAPAAFGKFIGPAAAVFPFSGFFRPVDNLPTVNTVKAGRAIPVKFSLGGDRGLAIFAPGYPKSQQVQCASAAPFNAIEVTVTAGNSGLSYDSATGTYTYVWKTDKAWSGTCRRLTVRLSDGSDHSAQFVFR